MSVPALCEGPRARPCARMLEVLLGYDCAAKCPFCYNPPLTNEVLSQRLSFRSACELLFSKRAEGYDGVWFTGGEVTQRPDLPKLLRLARGLGYRHSQIVTNAIRLSDGRYAGLLARAGLTHARLSIHGGEATHDRITAIPGSFAKAVRAIERLRAQNVQIALNFVLNRWNAAELPRFVRLAAATWGVDDIDVLFPHYRGMMRLNESEIGVTYAHAARWMEKAVDAASGARIQLVNFPPCTLPAALLPRIADWRREDCEGHAVASAAGEMELSSMKSAQKSQGPGCRGCRHEADCMGFEREYSSLFGDHEFKAVAL